VETVNLRTTTLRSPSGELFVVPNGEIRIVRNFSRGRFSSATVSIKLNAEDLSRVIPILEDLGKEALLLLPNLLEPWQIISQSGFTGAADGADVGGQGEVCQGGRDAATTAGAGA
jgi:small-conductance mechanosensitive channel